MEKFRFTEFNDWIFNYKCLPGVDVGGTDVFDTP
jgi:hypothetical protein